MRETYRIDEGERRVYVTVDGEELPGKYMEFRHLAEDRNEGDGLSLSPHTPERLACYRIATDELLDRGLI